MNQNNFDPNQNNNYAPPHHGGYAYAAPMQKKKRPIWPWILAGAVALLIGLIIWAGVAATKQIAEWSSTNDSFSLVQRGPGQIADYGYSYNQPYLGVLYVEGTMTTATSLYAVDGSYHHEYLLSTIEQLQNDSQNRGLLLYINTPGGEMMAAVELGEAIAHYKEETGRPVYAYGHSYATSGGYWIAAAADQIYINQYGLTGSIGVTYGTVLDISQLLENYGIKTHTFTSGDQKGMGSMFEEMSPETEAIYQSIVDEYYQSFLDWIVAERGIAMNSLLPLADGRIYSATQAKQNGLIDAVGDYDDCLAALLAVCGENCAVYDYFPTYPQNFLQQLLRSQQSDDDLSALLEALPPSGLLTYYNEAN